MIPWIQLDSAKIPGGREELRLKRRGSEFSIMLGANELMNSRLSGSEEALARLSCAALAELPPDAAVVVAEIVPSVIAWARGPMTELFAGSLDDPSVEIREADVADLIAEGKSTYDAILLDVDNGPDGLSRGANDRLYGFPGLAAARKALKPGGVLAVWSAHPDRSFAARLRQSGFEVEEINTRARGKRGARHVIWLATRR